MTRLTAIGFLLMAFFGFLSSPVNAQVNLKIGYNLSFLSDQGLDQVISAYNASRSYTTPFSRLRWTHGLEAGFRFKSHEHALELTYQNGYQHFKAIGNLSGGSETFKDQIRFAIHSAAIGYQVSGEIIGLGTDLQYQWYNTKVTLAEATNPFIDVQKLLALKFYGMITLKGNKEIDIALQPYYILPFEAYSLEPLSRYLQEEENRENSKWTRIGLTVLFYNGKK